MFYFFWNMMTKYLMQFASPSITVHQQSGLLQKQKQIITPPSPSAQFVMRLSVVITAFAPDDLYLVVLFLTLERNLEPLSRKEPKIYINSHYVKTCILNMKIQVSITLRIFTILKRFGERHFRVFLFDSLIKPVQNATFQSNRTKLYRL